MQRVRSQQSLAGAPLGSYALVLHIGSRDSVRAGALGRLSLEPGFLIYLGSARGSGGLRARLAHHCRVPHRPHWHIDYLRTGTSVLGAWLCVSPERLEHRWAAAVGQMRGAVSAAQGFGSSDCACPTHLLWFADLPSAATFRRALGSASFSSKPYYLGEKRLRRFAGFAA